MRASVCLCLGCLCSLWKYTANKANGGRSLSGSSWGPLGAPKPRGPHSCFCGGPQKGPPQQQLKVLAVQRKEGLLLLLGSLPIRLHRQSLLLLLLLLHFFLLPLLHFFVLLLHFILLLLLLLLCCSRVRSTRVYVGTLLSLLRGVCLLLLLLLDWLRGGPCGSCRPSQLLLPGCCWGDASAH